MHDALHGSILRRAGPLMLARVAIAVLTFAIPMVLARILLPASYGTFKQAWLLSNTLFLVLPMGLNQSLVYFTPRQPDKRGAWESHALLLTTAMGVLAAGLLLAVGPLVASAFHNPELVRLMPAVAAFTAFRLAGSSLDLALMSEGRIKESAVVRVASEGFYTACLVAGALWTRSLDGAFAGMIVATCAKALACWAVLARPGMRVSPGDLRRQLAYALPFGAASALVIPQQQFHSYLVSATATSAVFAVYSVGCFQLPIVDMLYTPVSEVLQLGIAEHDARKDDRGALRLFRDAVAKLSFVFLPSMVLLAIVAPVLIRFLFTDRYLDAAPIFRLALLSIPMSALPLEGVMRARAQNKFMFRISVLKIALTVPFVWTGLRIFGPIGALGGWICAEETCRLLLLRKTARLFGTTTLGVLPREMFWQGLAALVAAVPAAVVLRIFGGPLFLQLAATSLVFAMAYLAALRALGILPPVRRWIPRRRPDLVIVREAA